MIKHNVLASVLFVIACVGIVGKVSATPGLANEFGVGCVVCHTSGSGNEDNVRGAARSAYNKGRAALQEFVNGNTKPVISPIGLEWDTEVGQELSIPLSVFDAQNDDFQILGHFPIGATLSKEYIDSHQLPTVDFQWIAAADQANQVYTVKFTAKETATILKLSSAPVFAKIRVWPAGDRNQASVQKLVVSTVKWGGDKLSLKGKVVLNKIMTASEKTNFLSRTDLAVNITQGVDGTGPDISALLPITFDSKGGWTLSDIGLSASTPFSCGLTVEFEGKKASRKIAGAPKTCIKPK